MQRRNLGVLAVVVIVAVVGFVIASSGSDDKSSGSKQARPIAIVVKGAKPVGGVRHITVNKGDRVRFTVQSDVADEIHVHGYNFMKDVPKGGKISFDFPAKIDGDFEVELEGRKQQIADLAVNP
jgi:heme/copper-type cytochrome/quinol oxidase subunit 2